MTSPPSTPSRAMAPDSAIGFDATVVAVAVGALVAEDSGPTAADAADDGEAADEPAGLPATGVGAGVDAHAATRRQVAARSRARPADRAPGAIEERYAPPGAVGSLRTAADVTIRSSGSSGPGG